MAARTFSANAAPQADVHVTTGDPQIEQALCSQIRVEDPCILVIMGATGDLTARKLMPALLNLYLNDSLPDPMIIVGCGRSGWTDESFRQTMTQCCHRALDEKILTDRPAAETFVQRLFYQRLNYDSHDDYNRLAQRLTDLEHQFGTRGNRLFYLALPPSIYSTAARCLGAAGLGASPPPAWTRLVVEKPFGHDLDSAVELDKAIRDHFDEPQVFRIDHYLAKETVQNVLMFRFANAIFEPLWNRRYIDYVTISATETLGVEHRAGYYEQAGVIRDMFQNHMMMVLALIAMEPPSRFEAEQVRDERAKVFRALRPWSATDMHRNLVLGQYAHGQIDGQVAVAYRAENDVRADSQTPTYARMQTYIDNWRWQGVPFILTSGKRLAQKRTEIAIHFKEVPHSLFRQNLGTPIQANRLTIGIYPEENITLTFQTKHPGARVCLRSVTMEVNYHQQSEGPVTEAYEKVLLDCMLGDQMLFWRQDGVEHCWSLFTPVLDWWEQSSHEEADLHFYAAGSRGPSAADRLMPAPARKGARR